MDHLLRVLLVCALFGALAACRSTAVDREPREPAPEGYTLVILHASDPAPDLSSEEISAAMAGHFSNMAVLAEAGHLLLAGPLGPPRIEPAQRGIFVLDTVDQAEARAWTATDPSVVAGIFTPEFQALRSRAALRAIVALDAAAVDARLAADPELTRERAWVGRSYVLARGPLDPSREGLAADLEARGSAALVLEVGSGDARELWLVLDAEDLDTARAALGEQIAAWTLHGWYATDVLPDLPRVARQP